MKKVRIVIEVEGKRYQVVGHLEPIGQNPTEKAQVRDAQRRVEKKAAAQTGAVCPDHGKAMMGKYGLFCPVAVGEKPDGRTRYCNWRPAAPAKTATAA